MGTGRLLRACMATLVLLAAVASARPALAQANFDRPGGDYLSAPVTSGDPADCALVCERDRRCRAWPIIAASPACAARASSRRGTVRSKPRSTALAATTGIST